MTPKTETVWECPQCGNDLERAEDEYGVSFACMNMECLGFFDAREIEEMDDE